MNTYVTIVLQRHRQGTILLDTNLLLLYFVGLFNQEVIPKFNRTRKFAVEDYSTLVNFLTSFKTIATTPNILTEVSNLSNQLPVSKSLKQEYFDVFARGIALLDEHYCASSDLAKMEELKRFGITDAGILHLARNNYLVVTDDFKLSQYLQSKGIDTLNFDHIRPINWR